MSIDRRAALQRVITLQRETLAHLEALLKAEPDAGERRRLRIQANEVLDQLRAAQRELEEYITSLQADATGQIDRGDYEQARSMYQEIAELCQTEGDARGESAALRMIGQLFQTENRYVEALPYLERALELAHITGDLDLEGHALAQLAFLSHRAGRSDEAEGLYLAAEERLRATDDKRALAEVLWNLGWLCRYERWDDARAIRLWEEAVRYMIETGFPGVGDYRQNLLQLKAVTEDRGQDEKER